MAESLRILVALGLTLLLVVLRIEAGRFGAAEYDEPAAGGRPSVLRRLAWYLLGIGGVVAIGVIHPGATSDLFLRVGDPFGAVSLGLVLAGLGAAQAVAVAWLHYQHLRLPSLGSYPGALLNELATAAVDEAVFRGAFLGFLIVGGVPTGFALLGQAIVYTLATRTGAPGRDRYTFVLAFGIGLVAGWATLSTGGIGAAFLGHAVTRVTVFLTTGHAGQLALAGTEDEDLERRRRTPDGWRVVGLGGGSRESRGGSSRRGPGRGRPAVRERSSTRGPAGDR